MTPLQLDTHASLVVRPIEPTDRDALAAAFSRLSHDSRMRRFLGPKRYLSERELTYLTEIDHETHEALIAVDPGGNIVAVARYAAWPHSSGDTAELAFVVIDAWQRRGIASVLTAQVVARARENGIRKLTATTFGDNMAARVLLGRLGFTPVGTADGLLSYELDFPAGEEARSAPARPRRLLRIGANAIEVAIRRSWRPAY
ncbi:MAG TPA: GNAT family N-acetyltransferase [Thermoleophilaceae bacterium]